MKEIGVKKKKGIREEEDKERGKAYREGRLVSQTDVAGEYSWARSVNNITKSGQVYLELPTQIR